MVQKPQRDLDDAFWRKSILPDCTRLFASVAFGKGSKAKLHTRVNAATQLVKIAGGLAQEVPDTPDEG